MTVSLRTEIASPCEPTANAAQSRVPRAGLRDGPRRQATVTTKSARPSAAMIAFGVRPVTGLERDLEHGVLQRHAGQIAMMRDVDDVAARVADDRGDRREHRRAGP